MRTARWRVCLAALALLLALAARPAAQALTVHVVDDVLHVRVRGLGLLEGETLRRLRDGRSVRVDFDITVHEGRGGPVLTARRERFTVSYDLWEERFAVIRVATPPASMSHLTRADAEAWCIEHLSLPMGALAPLGRDAPFWIGVAYRAVAPEVASDAGAESGFTLRRLIDLLSRRRTAGDGHASVESGPFRLSALRPGD